MIVMLMLMIIKIVMLMLDNLDMLHSSLPVINSDKSGSLRVVDIVLELRVHLVLRRRHLCPLRPLQPHPRVAHIGHIFKFSLFHIALYSFTLVTSSGFSKVLNRLEQVFLARKI